MSILDNADGLQLNNNVDSVVNATEPLRGEDPKNVLGEDKEIVNEEDQNQVVNAQPVEEFVSNYVNKEESEAVGVPAEKVEE